MGRVTQTGSLLPLAPISPVSYAVVERARELALYWPSGGWAKTLQRPSI